MRYCLAMPCSAVLPLLLWWLLLLLLVSVTLLELL